MSWTFGRKEILFGSVVRRFHSSLQAFDRRKNLSYPREEMADLSMGERKQDVYMFIM